MNNAVRRSIAGATLGVLAAVGGGLTAEAYTWATSSTALGVYSGGKWQGWGYGTFYRSGTNGILRSTLKDSVTGGGRTWASGKAYAGPKFFSVQSGRAIDGENIWRSNTRTTYNVSIARYQGEVRVCQDITAAPDPCSGPRTGNL